MWLVALNKITNRIILSAGIIRFCAGFSIAIWKAPFIFSKFPGSESAFAGKCRSMLTISYIKNNINRIERISKVISYVNKEKITSKRSLALF